MIIIMIIIIIIIKWLSNSFYYDNLNSAFLT